jgi:hypothetical protein
VRPFPLLPLAIALALMAVCVVVHALVLALLFRWLNNHRAPGRIHFLRAAALLVQVAFWLVLAHLVEMSIWAVALVRLGALQDMVDSIYFSMITYTTVGYGDLVLPLRWHALAGVEGLTGILMAGWSTGFLFAVVNRMMLRMELAGGEAPGDAA